MTHADHAMTSLDSNTSDLRRLTTYFSHNPNINQPPDPTTTNDPNTRPNHDPQPTLAIPTSSFKHQSQPKKKKKTTEPEKERRDGETEKGRERRELK